MIAVCRILLVSLVFLIAIAPAGAASRQGRPSVAMPSLEALKQQAMIFFVAKGAPNSCGPGCSEWIAAEGALDAGVPERFRAFLDTLPRRDLPIFFNSIGGLIGQGARLGIVLRENRMSVGVGRTVAEGCSDTGGANDGCRRILNSKREHTARLVTKGARCNSACVYAFAGGSRRTVAQDAMLGVHSARPLPPGSPLGRHLSVDEIHHLARSHVVEMGIEPSLVDATAKVSADTMHYLSRAEMARFGMETRGRFETRWTMHGIAGGSWAASKAISEPAATGSDHRTSVARFTCGKSPGSQELVFVYRRERVVGENTTVVAEASIAAGERNLRLRPVFLNKWTHLVNANVEISFARHAATASKLEIFEYMSAQGKTQTLGLTTEGLSQALEQLQSRCGVRRQPDAKPNASAKGR